MVKVCDKMQNWLQSESILKDLGGIDERFSAFKPRPRARAHVFYSHILVLICSIVLRQNL